MSRSDRWNINKSTYILLDKMQNVMKKVIKDLKEHIDTGTKGNWE
jgi:uncharacterized protein (DUF302 family)